MAANDEVSQQIPNGTHKDDPRSKSTADYQDDISTAIKYRVQYRNEAGEPIDEEEQYKPWPNFVSADEEEKTGSILDIITYVTIRELSMTTTVDDKDSAQNAGSNAEDQSKEKTPKADSLSKKSADDLEPAIKNKRFKGKRFEIKSVNETEMEIRSSALVKAIRAQVDYYPSQQLTGSTINVPEPYYFLLHYRKELEALRHPAGEKIESGLSHERFDDKTQEHVDVLLAYLDAKYLKKIEEEENRHNRKIPTATFEMLWMLLRPGTEVFTDVDGELAAFVVRSVRPNIPTKFSHYVVTLWYMNFDGRRVGRCAKMVNIPSFNGERDITALKVFPISKASDSARRKKLEQAGEHYFDILRKGHEEVTYDGHTLATKRRHHKGRVVLDPASFWSYSKTDDSPPETGLTDDDSMPDIVASCDCDSCIAIRSQGRNSKWSGYDDIDPRSENVRLTPNQCLLLPRKIPGFVLKSRTWELLDINCVSSVVNNESAIKNLVMDDNHLKMVKVLTDRFDDGQQRGQSSSWSADFIGSKGEGQIFLLHGPPGVGKTYTTECIAEYTRRPLLALTCADIGTNEKEIESTLSAWFSLAEIWGAVMLIDEADIYLEIRSTGDLQRNSLVSAFLRSMEYYRGILFLTTNRIGQIDDAIMSRVHLVVKYETLNPAARNRIWEQFVDKLMEDQENFSVESRASDYVQEIFEDTEVEWNGREIRNAIQTAVALAEHEAKTAVPPLQKVKLKRGHIKDVIEMSQVFKKYLKKFKGDEAERALKDGTRLDKEKSYEGDMKSKLAAARAREGR